MNWFRSKTPVQAQEDEDIRCEEIIQESVCVTFMLLPSADEKMVFQTTKLISRKNGNIHFIHRCTWKEKLSAFMTDFSKKGWAVFPTRVERFENFIAASIQKL